MPPNFVPLGLLRRDQRRFEVFLLVKLAGIQLSETTSRPEKQAIK
tara:strand:- start:162 stop:296 length:135 start_codon:yes stop_codon:yes gene_type:complete